MTDLKKTSRLKRKAFGTNVPGGLQHIVEMLTAAKLLSPFLVDRILTVALMLQCCVCRRLSVCMECIVAKRCVLEQKLLLKA